MDFRERVFKLEDKKSFEILALEIFRYQAEHNQVYKQYLDNLKISPKTIEVLDKIPFLPIEFFKNYKVIVENSEVQKIFKSSGTSDSGLSNHYVADLSLYEKSFINGFEFFFGPTDQYCILALLPSYLEQENSSLIYMVRELINRSNHTDSAFYLNSRDELEAKLEELENKGKKTILIGVTYALLDFIEKHKLRLKNTIVMETGGMKGRRKEMLREEVHAILREGLGIEKIYSEYGMTELLSQAYSKGNGIFNAPPWMRVMIRDIEDPLHFLEDGKTGGVNIIDLANIYSCSFIATQDLGKKYADDSFEILGRFDNSDIRGCNLLID